MVRDIFVQLSVAMLSYVQTLKESRALKILSLHLRRRRPRRTT